MLYLGRRNNPIHQHVLESDQLDSSLVEMNQQIIIQKKTEHEPEIHPCDKDQNHPELYQ